MKVPNGFFWAGMQAGIKPNRKDLALLYSDAPCSAAGCFTQNLAKAAPVLDAEKRLPADGIRAVVINSGNANALTGPEGLEDVKTVCEAVAKELQVGASAVVSASTGVIGVRLPFIIAAVLALSFLLLMAVFRSVLVPLKAVVMNLLSIGAAYGVVVAVFQWGWLGGLAGIDRDGTPRHFPLLSTSIAAFEVDGSRSITPDVIAETLRQTKALAKAKPGCTCLLAAGDRIIDLVSRSESPDRSVPESAPRVAAHA